VSAHAGLTAVFSLVILGLGVAILARTLVEGGGEVGYLLGSLFVVAGAGRLYLARRR
jgi:DNA-binding transcriptional LysR family regulator